MFGFGGKKIRSSRLKEKIRKKRIKTVGITVMVLFVLFMTPFSLSRLDYFAIKSVSVDGNQTVLTGAVVSSVTEGMSKKIWGLYPKSHVALLSVRSIEEKLHAEFPKIKEVNVSRKNMNELAVSVSEREPFALWCYSIDSTNCLYIDDNAFAYEQAPAFTSNIFMKFVTDRQEMALAKTVLPAEEFARIKYAIKYLENETLPVSLIDVKTDGDADFYLSRGGKILFKVEEIQNEISNLESVLHDDSLGLRGEDGITALYIDLRFGNKVYYKKLP